MNKLRVFEAFAGIGTQSKALKNLGVPYEVVGISEWDVNAIMSYDAIHTYHEVPDSLSGWSEEAICEELLTRCISTDGKIPLTEKQIKSMPLPKQKNILRAMIRQNNLGSISNVTPEDIPDCDLFTYSFPCQDISVIGDMKGLDEGSNTRTSLLWECRKIIACKKPKFLLLENVKQLVGKKHKHNLDKWLGWLESQGYTNYVKVINATECGVAQNRERTFVVSILDGTEFSFPPPQPLEKRLVDYLEEDGSAWVVPHHVIVGYSKKQSVFKKRFRIKEMEDIAYCLTAKSGRAVITNNYIYADKRLYKNKPCANNDIDFIAENNIPVRSLTPLEYWRLMGMSDEDYYRAAMVVSPAQLYKQAGNAIVVDVLMGIFRNLLQEYS